MNDKNKDLELAKAIAAAFPKHSDTKDILDALDLVRNGVLRMVVNDCVEQKCDLSSTIYLCKKIFQSDVENYPEIRGHITSIEKKAKETIADGKYGGDRAFQLACRITADFTVISNQIQKHFDDSGKPYNA
jgi:hypothetical protein